MDVYFEVSNLLAHFQQLHYIARVPLNGLDAHVVVHSFLHKCGVRKCLSIVRDVEGIQFGEIWQVIEHVGLVIAQVADGVLTIVWVLEGANAQIWEAVQVEHLLEVAYLIVGDVELFLAHEAIKAHPDALYAVAGEVQFSQAYQVVQTVRAAPCL